MADKCNIDSDYTSKDGYKYKPCGCCFSLPIEQHDAGFKPSPAKSWETISLRYVKKSELKQLIDKLQHSYDNEYSDELYVGHL